MMDSQGLDQGSTDMLPVFLPAFLSPGYSTCLFEFEFAEFDQARFEMLSMSDLLKSGESVFPLTTDSTPQYLVSL